MSVPKLRFPEFRDSGEWEEKELSQVCEINPSVNNLPETFVYIDLESVDSGNLLQKKIISREGAPSRAQRLLKRDDVIFQMVRPYQRNNYYFNVNDGISYVASTGYAQLRAYDSSLYLFQYLHNDNFVDRVLAKCTGSNYPAINSSDLSTILVEVPSLLEQQKIADCLSSLDDRITLETQKLDTLKAHKKGLMHQLFPAEGETLPKLRFPEFRDSREWVEKAISEIIPPSDKYAIVDGPFGSNLKTIHYQSEGVPIITSGYVTDGFFNVDKYLYVSQEKFEKEKRSAVRGGDIVMAKIGARCGASAIIPNSHEVGILSGNALKITIDKSRFITSFIWQILWGLHTNQSLNVLISVGAQPAISLVNLKKYKLTLPTKKEQKKIADCLASIDEAIAAQSQAIDLLKLHKKGLMQQLFPSVEEVKG